MSEVSSLYHSLVVTDVDLHLLHSAPSRMSDPATDSLLSSANSSLQDLGVVPQTIFFSIRPQSEVLNVARTRLSTQSPSEFAGAGFLGRRSSSNAGHGGDIPRSPNSPGERPGAGRSVSGGQLTDDLRRRLALGGAGGSNASLASLQHDGLTVPNEAGSPGRKGGLGSPISLNAGGGGGEQHLHLKRTVSQTDTEISDITASTSTSTFSNPTTTATSQRPPARSRVRLSGVEVAKVSPAVAEDSTNAMGLFDVDARYREGSEAEVASAAGTELNSIAGTGTGTGMLGRSAARKVVLPQRFVSTYGEFAIVHSQRPPVIDA